METYKTLWFIAQGPWGFSEVHFQQASSARLALGAAADVQLLAARRSLFGSKTGQSYYTPEITDIRVSNVSTPRDSLKQSVDQTSSGPPNREDADIPNTSINLGWTGRDDNGFNYSKIQFCRGNPDTLVGKGGRFQFGTSWNPSLANYKTQLIDKHFGVYAQDKSVTKIAIASLAQAGADIVVNTVTPHGFAPGSKVTITGVKPLFSEKKSFVIWAPSGTIFTLPNLTLKTPIKDLGFAKLISKIFVEYEEVTVIRANHRIAGRPFFQPRGRQRTEVEA